MIDKQSLEKMIEKQEKIVKESSDYLRELKYLALNIGANVDKTPSLVKELEDMTCYIKERNEKKRLDVIKKAEKSGNKIDIPKIGTPGTLNIPQTIKNDIKDKDDLFKEMIDNEMLRTLSEEQLEKVRLVIIRIQTMKDKRDEVNKRPKKQEKPNE
jgi:hypothetical protein